MIAPRSLGRILRDAAGLCARHAGVLLPVAAVYAGAPALLDALLLPARGPELSPAWIAVSLVGAIVPAFLGSMASAQALAAIATGRRPGAAAAIRAPFRTARASVAAALLYAGIVLAGLLLFVLPGLYSTIALWLAPATLAVEGGTARGALARSLALTRGEKLRITGLLVVALALIAPAHALAAWALPPGAPAGTLMTVAAETVVGMFGDAAGFLLYLDVRSRREGLDADALAASLAASAA